MYWCNQCQCYHRSGQPGDWSYRGRRLDADDTRSDSQREYDADRRADHMAGVGGDYDE